MMMKREYRGQRSVKALADYIRQQKSNPVHEIQSLDEVTTLDVSYVWWMKCVLPVKLMQTNQNENTESAHSLTVYCSLLDMDKLGRLSWIRSQGNL